MANYLMRYKGSYKLMPDIDLELHDFARGCDDAIDEDMIYIACYNGVKVWYYGLNESRRAVLGAYIPNLQKGRNIKKALKKEKIEIFNYDEGDDESIFYFLASDIERVMPFLKPYKTGVKTSPFSNKYLPSSDVVIPSEDMAQYKQLSSKIGKNDMLLIKNANARFLSEIVEKELIKKTKNKKFSCRQDMKQLKMSRQFKEYVWYRGYWNKYISYLDNAITEYYNNKE